MGSWPVVMALSPVLLAGWPAVLANQPKVVSKWPAVETFSPWRRRTVFLLCYQWFQAAGKIIRNFSPGQPLSRRLCENDRRNDENQRVHAAGFGASGEAMEWPGMAGKET